MIRERIGAVTKRYEKAVTFLFALLAAGLAVSYLVIAPGHSADPMLTPLGSRIEYAITRPAVIGYLVLLYVWSIWATVFTAPRKEIAASLSTILTGVAIWLWIVDVARPVMLVLMVIGLAHGVIGIVHAFHRQSQH